MIPKDFQDALLSGAEVVYNINIFEARSGKLMQGQNTTCVDTAIKLAKSAKQPFGIMDGPTRSCNASCKLNTHSVVWHMPEKAFDTYPAGMDEIKEIKIWMNSRK